MMLLDLTTGDRFFSRPDGGGEPFIDESCWAGRTYGIGMDRPCEPCGMDYRREARWLRKQQEAEHAQRRRGPYRARIRLVDGRFAYKEI